MTTNLAFSITVQNDEDFDTKEDFLEEAKLSIPLVLQALQKAIDGFAFGAVRVIEIKEF